jgi:hypothetical protein
MGATAAIAALLYRVSDKTFFTQIFRLQAREAESQ